MRMDHLDYRQPFSVALAGATAAKVGSNDEVGASWFDPFLDLVFSAGSTGLVAVSDTHRDSEEEMSCVTNALTGATKCL